MLDPSVHTHILYLTARQSGASVNTLVSGYQRAHNTARSTWRSGLQVVLSFTGGKPQSPWHDPEKSRNQPNAKIIIQTMKSTSKNKPLVHQLCSVQKLYRPTCPPAAQAATRPYCPPSFCSRWATVVTNLQPVAPNGWPRDREPPHRLNFSMGGVPTYMRHTIQQLMFCARCSNIRSQVNQA